MAWDAAIGAIQSRRRRRGKTIIFPKGVQPIWEKGSRGKNMVTANESKPIRVNYGSAKQGKSEIVKASELTSLILPTTGGALNEGFVNFTAIKARDVSLWPMLTSKAVAYSRFECTALTFTFTPTVGSAVNGTVYLAFSNDPNQAVGTQTVQDILSFPVSKSESVSSALAITVPANLMNRGSPAGQLLCDDSGFLEGTGDANLYYAGWLYYAVSNLSVQSGSVPNNLGKITVSYTMTLRMPITPSTGSDYQVYFGPLGNITQRISHMVSVKNLTTTSCSLCCNRPMNLIVRDIDPSPSPDTLAISWLGTPLTPVWQATDTTQRVSVFQLEPSLNGELVYTLNGATVFGISKTDAAELLWDL